ncbi:unnamed protein product [Phytophthora fragariaefolia]|uniref:Unnamed protein product n=1 Tax=Phytophthora fragariaefolia TaxID=1490495 RepID=A0A9W6X693_9STRA|nr:unnamed protein product [Phytophthora fragariaefolia]
MQSVVHIVAFDSGTGSSAVDDVDSKNSDTMVAADGVLHVVSCLYRYTTVQKGRKYNAFVDAEVDVGGSDYGDDRD